MAGYPSNATKTVWAFHSVIASSLAAQLSDIKTRENDFDVANYGESIAVPPITTYHTAPKRTYKSPPELCTVVSGLSVQRKGGEKFGYHTLLSRLIVGGKNRTSELTAQELLVVQLSRICEAIEAILEANTYLTVSTVNYANQALVGEVEFDDIYLHDNTKGNEIYRSEALIRTEVQTLA